MARRVWLRVPVFIAAILATLAPAALPAVLAWLLLAPLGLAVVLLGPFSGLGGRGRL